MSTPQHLLALAITLLCVAGTAHGTESLENGSFDAVMINRLPEGWELFCPPAAEGLLQAGRVNYVLDSGTFRSATGSISIRSDQPVRTAILQRGIPCSPGSSWRFSIWMKGENLSDMPGAQVRITYLNASNREITSQLAAKAVTIPATESTFDWQEFTAKGTCPEGADRIQVELFLWKSSGTVWFDDASLAIQSADANAYPPRVDRAGKLRYHRQNRTLASEQPAARPRVVFVGDSITDNWPLGTFFPDQPGYVNRGISGQQTWQMVARFGQDAIHHKPDLVFILAGTNDLGGNIPTDVITANIEAMADACLQNNVPLVVCSLLPISDYTHGQQRTVRRPPEKILEINDALRQMCQTKGITYLDLHSALKDADGFLPASLSNDGLHPNAAGYSVMAPIVQAALERELSKAN